MSAPVRAWRLDWYMIAGVWLTSTAMAMLALIIAVHVSAESDRKWCSVISTLDDAWQESPPTTASGRNLALDIGQLRDQLDCPKG